MGESGLKVVRVRSSEAFHLDGPLVEFLAKIFEDREDRDAEQVASWMGSWLPNLAVYVAVEGGQMTGLAVLSKHEEPMAPPAMILEFYIDPSAGSRTRAELVESIVGWMHENDVGRIWAINRTGRSDEAHMRLFRSHARGQRLGSVLEYDISGDEK